MREHGSLKSRAPIPQISLIPPQLPLAEFSLQFRKTPPPKRLGPRPWCRSRPLTCFHTFLSENTYDLATTLPTTVLTALGSCRRCLPGLCFCFSCYRPFSTCSQKIPLKTQARSCHSVPPMLSHQLQKSPRSALCSLLADMLPPAQPHDSALLLQRPCVTHGLPP